MDIDIKELVRITVEGQRLYEQYGDPVLEVFDKIVKLHQQALEELLSSPEILALLETQE